MDVHAPLAQHVDNSNSSDHDETKTGVFSKTVLIEHGGWADQEHALKQWRPFFLLPMTVAVFGVVFALILISLEIINKVASVRHGIGPEKPGNHYLWTYGPTAGKAPLYLGSHRDGIGG
jgi:hypothetical protein